MLAKKYRLPVSAFNANVKTIRTNMFTLKLGKNNLLHSRYGVIASKQVDKRAVVRNRVKRLLMISLSSLLDETVNGYDMLFIVRKEMVGVISLQVTQSLQEIWKKNNLYAV